MYTAPTLMVLNLACPKFKKKVPHRIFTQELLFFEQISLADATLGFSPAHALKTLLTAVTPYQLLGMYKKNWKHS